MNLVTLCTYGGEDDNKPNLVNIRVLENTIYTCKTKNVKVNEPAKKLHIILHNIWPLNAICTPELLKYLKERQQDLPFLGADPDCFFLQLF